MPRVNHDSKIWEQAWNSYKLEKNSYKTKSKYIKSRNEYHNPIFVEMKRIRESIKEVDAERHKLKLKRDNLIRELKALNKKKNDEKKNKLKKPIVLYALKLEDEKYYIGLTRNITKRFISHKKGMGSWWTKIYQPIEIIEIRKTNIISESEASKLEDKMTIEYAIKYGTDNVRGGGYCQRKPRWNLSL